MEKRFKKIAVLKGGVSSEREVSLRSGAAIAQGLREGGYEVEEIDIIAREVCLPDGIEAVFIALHGEFGEDGGIQELLTAQGIPFTGSDAESSRVSFDKILTRDRLTAHDIPVPNGEVLNDSAERTLPVPLVVKPPREGSSVGCHMVTQEAEWETAYSDAARFSDEVLVEEYIPGRELTVGIVELGSENPGQGTSEGEQHPAGPTFIHALSDHRKVMVLPIVEIKPAAQWYDYEAKYMTGETQYIVPAELDEECAEQMRVIALKTFESLDAAGFGRVDFRLSPEGKPYVLELNAIPGFTETSLLPKAAAAAGIGFSELCCLIMNLASLSRPT